MQIHEKRSVAVRVTPPQGGGGGGGVASEPVETRGPWWAVFATPLEFYLAALCLPAALLSPLDDGVERI